MSGTMTASHDPYQSRVGGGSEVVRREDPVIWGDAPGPLGREDVERYRTHGFVVMRGLLSPAEAGALLAEAERAAAAVDRTRADVILEPKGEAVRSLFAVHRDRGVFARLTADPRIAGAARQILSDDVYVHQSRINFKPAFEGEPFSWHSDFETWHVEDGMPRMRAVSASLLLTENTEHNGPLLVVPGSHHWYVRCAGVTPPEHYKVSLRAQEYGSPARAAIAKLAEETGVASVTGPPGTVVFFDCNLLHGSAGNITPLARHNVFVVYNAMTNRLVSPFGTSSPRPSFLAEREGVALRSGSSPA
jgi:ectoine hydroxylase